MTRAHHCIVPTVQPLLLSLAGLSVRQGKQRKNMDSEYHLALPRWFQ